MRYLMLVVLLSFTYSSYCQTKELETYNYNGVDVKIGDTVLLNVNKTEFKYIQLGSGENKSSTPPFLIVSKIMKNELGGSIALLLKTKDGHKYTCMYKKSIDEGEISIVSKVKTNGIVLTEVTNDKFYAAGNELVKFSSQIYAGIGISLGGVAISAIGIAGGSKGGGPQS